MSDGTIGENLHKETRDIHDLVKRKGMSDISNIKALERTRLTIDNSNGGM